MSTEPDISDEFMRFLDESGIGYEGGGVDDWAKLVAWLKPRRAAVLEALGMYRQGGFSGAWYFDDEQTP